MLGRGAETGRRGGTHVHLDVVVGGDGRVQAHLQPRVRAVARGRHHQRDHQLLLAVLRRIGGPSVCGSRAERARRRGAPAAAPCRCRCSSRRSPRPAVARAQRPVRPPRMPLPSERLLPCIDGYASVGERQPRMRQTAARRSAPRAAHARMLCCPPPATCRQRARAALACSVMHRLGCFVLLDWCPRGARGRGGCGPRAPAAGSGARGEAARRRRARETRPVERGARAADAAPSVSATRGLVRRVSVSMNACIHRAYWLPIDAVEAVIS